MTPEDEADYKRIDDEAAAKYAQEDELTQQKRMLPPGLVMRVRVYDPTISGTATTVFRGACAMLMLSH